jgi:hypothetical protein
MTSRTSLVILCAALLLTSGCGQKPQSQASGAGAEWRLSTLPAVDIGVAEGDEPYELVGAGSSLRFPDGPLVVANAGSSQLRFFDSQGRFIKAVGRRGEGPGEFTGFLHLSLLTNETFSVYDQGQLRLSVFDTAGVFAGDTRVVSEGRESFPLRVWLYRRNWVDGPVDTLERMTVARALDRMPPVPAGSYRFVKIADDGRVWAQLRRSVAPDSAEPWDIYSTTGNRIARIGIPDRPEIHQIGHDFITVRQWAANQVEHIQLYRIEGITSGDESLPEDESAPPETGSTVSDATLDQLAAGMRNLVMLQEMYFAEHNQYAESAAEFAGKTPEGTSLHLMVADKRGWVGLLTHRTAPVLCGMAVGGSTPPGWMEGVPKCSRRGVNDL